MQPRAVTFATLESPASVVYDTRVRWWLLLLILTAFIFAMRRSLSRWTELFVIDVRDGLAVLRRGRLPHALFDDIADISARPPLKHAQVVVRREAGVARVFVRGDITDGHLQQLRNVVGRYPLAKIQAGGKTA